MRFDLTPRPSRPLLLLDIDGVVCVLGDGGGQRLLQHTVDEHPVQVAERAPERLSRLSGAFLIVWASSWEQRGAEGVAPLVGLPPDLPYLIFDTDNPPLGVYWKMNVVERFADTKPVAFVDDELPGSVFDWAASRPHPTLVIRPDPRVGLDDQHVEELLRFAAQATMAGD